ncbi:sugar kinase [Amycolatopsis suaedae]|uniref:sugar kinase n=1 Tax=Amycolatopsis suaedae TaxID=2510978 RepID=UPI00196AD12B|nr:sugar kinase [Amycolatopsis suaedae]
MAQAVCVGESMALFVPAEPGPARQVRTWRRTVGGAESNVACHLVALGVPSRWVSAVGADPLGAALLDELAGAGVDVGAVRVDPERQTGLYLKEGDAAGSTVRYYRTGSAASAMGPDLLAGLDLTGVRLVHLSGITPALSRSCHDLVTALLRAPRDGRIVSFDVNWRPKLWPDGDGPRVLAELAGLADVVLVGADEAEALWGTGDPAALAERLGNPPAVVVKRAEHGATLLENGTSTSAAALAVDVVEPVGAGDAFAAGFLAATLRGDDPRTRLRSGHLQAAATLLTHDDVAPPLPADVVTRLLRADDADWAATRLTADGLVPA